MRSPPKNFPAARGSGCAGRDGFAVPGSCLTGGCPPPERASGALPRSLRLLALLLALVLTGATRLAGGEPALPTAPTGRLECHGTLAGERFWLRLEPASREFGGNRVLHLLYTPPAPAVVAGARLPDCPRLLLDAHLRLVAYNGRGTLNRIVPSAKKGLDYAVTREIWVKDQTSQDPAPGRTPDEVPQEEKRFLDGPRAWDVRLAPLLIALAWRKGGPDASVRALDFFGPAAEATVVTWQGYTVSIAGRALKIEAGADGRLRRILDPAAAPGSATVLELAAWIDPAPAPTP